MFPNVFGAIKQLKNNLNKTYGLLYEKRFVTAHLKIRASVIHHEFAAGHAAGVEGQDFSLEKGVLLNVVMHR